MLMSDAAVARSIDLGLPRRKLWQPSDALCLVHATNQIVFAGA